MNSESILASKNADGLVIVYDGECPFCSNYVQVLALRETVGKVQLVDARSDHALVSKLQLDGYDLNEGMAALFGDRVYYGEECVHMLALLSSKSGMFNRINNVIFKSRTLSRVLYPILRAGRNITLKLLGRTKIPTPERG
jgi:predicted DCC family thiol-disulfide oxidoreductase YuxK